MLMDGQQGLTACNDDEPCCFRPLGDLVNEICERIEKEMAERRALDAELARGGTARGNVIDFPRLPAKINDGRAPHRRVPRV